jgi:hypothetical protein
MIERPPIDDKTRLLRLLWQKKDKRYRLGAIQCAYAFDLISLDEWVALDKQIRHQDNPQYLRLP